MVHLRHIQQLRNQKHFSQKYLSTADSEKTVPYHNKFTINSRSKRTNIKTIFIIIGQRIETVELLNQRMRQKQAEKLH